MKITATFFLASVLLSGCREPILHNLNEQQANQVWLELVRQRIGARKVGETAGWSIYVPESESASALAILAALRLPKSQADEKPSSSLIPTREERETYRERQLASRLEQTFESLPGVVEARVHLVLPSATESREALTRNASAGLLLVTGESFSLEAAQLREIVSGASGIPKESVAVAITALPGPSASLATTSNPS